METRHRVAFVGAGHISRFHAAALQRVPNAELVGIFELEDERSRRAALELKTRAFASFDEIAAAGVDVVHILTPPETHASLALRALERGAHVLVEKPLATDVSDCRALAAAARSRNRIVCVDHSLLFDPQVLRARDAVSAGKIGRLISIDMVRTAEYPPYEGGPLPPQYRTGGYPFRDLGVHQLYLIAAFLGPIDDVRAEWRSLGGDPNLAFDEWSAVVHARNGSAHVRISFNARPVTNVMVLHGTTGIMRVDLLSMCAARRNATRLPKAAERVVNAYGEALTTLVDVPRGVFGFLTGRVRQYEGLQRLVGEFYRALSGGVAVPATIEDALPIVDWVERVARAADADVELRERRKPAISERVPFLVTGAAGHLGRAVVARLRADGERVRTFVRANVLDTEDGTDVVTGDLGDPDAVERAVRGARVVVHVGAAMKGGWITQRASTVVGTRNIIDAAIKHGVEQLVYISSLSVIDWSDAPSGAPITESSPLEHAPQARGAYTRAKLEAELSIRDAVKHRGLKAVIIRPGQIFGGALPLLNPAVARRIGRFYVVLGDGGLRLPFVHVDDVVDAIARAIERRLVGGEVVQLVGEDLPTQNEILERALPKGARVLHVPRSLVFAAGSLSEILLGMVKRESPLSRYRLRSALARRTYVSECAARLLDWSPHAGADAVLENIVAARSR